MDDVVRSDVERLNQWMDKSPFKVTVARYDEIDFLEKNARFLTVELYRNLRENIKKDGQLSSVPFCWKQENGRYLVLSGNHRIQAAHEAGIDEYLILYTDRPMQKSERISRQLSHNALAGQDDMVILKELWKEIDDVQAKFYSGLDDKVLKAMEQISLPPLSEIKLDFKTAAIVFLPDEKARLDKLFAEALALVHTKDVYLARYEDFDRYLDALGKTQASYNVKNVATTLMLILNLFETHQEELLDGWWDGVDPKHKNWVPLSTIFGTDKVPAQSAAVIKKALDRAVGKKDVGKKNLWQLLELLATSYLAGKEQGTGQ